MPNAVVEDIVFNGMPALRLKAPDGAEATVLLHGAHVVSWKPAGGEERLYLSDTAVFKDGVPVRGGVPLCWPQFGQDGPLPQHGFVRTRAWEKGEVRCGDDFAMASLRLSDSEETRAMWPHAFKVEFSVSVTGGRLDMELEVENPGEAPLTFVASLHTYLRVREVEAVSLQGLHGQRYRNLLNKEKVEELTDTGTEVTIEQETTRLYYETKNALLLKEPHRALGIHADNMPDTVVWNPWENGNARITDMPADGFRRMLCVEASAIKEPVSLAAGASWWGRQTLVAL